MERGERGEAGLCTSLTQKLDAIRVIRQGASSYKDVIKGTVGIHAGICGFTNTIKNEY